MFYGKPILINLLAKDQAQKKVAVIYKSLVCIASLIFLGILVGLYLGELSLQKQELQRQITLQVKNQELDSRSIVTAPLEVLPEQLERKSERVRKIEALSASFIELIGETEKFMPKGLILTAVIIEGKKLTYKGIVNNYDDLVQFTAGFRTSPYITNIYLASTDLQNNNEIAFEISAEWRTVKK